jgi:hypothetical protein
MKDKQVYRNLSTVTQEDLDTVKRNFKWVADQLDHLIPPPSSRVIMITVYIIYRMFIVQAYQTSQYAVPRGGIFLISIHGVHRAGLSDFSVRGAVQRHFSREVAQLFRRKFRR